MMGEGAFSLFAGVIMLLIASAERRRSARTGQVRYGYSFGRRLVADRATDPRGFRLATAMLLFCISGGLIAIGAGLVEVASAL